MFGKLIKNSVNKFIKPSKKHIYFESAYYFYDNSYVLFNYIKEHYPKYKLHYACYKESQLKTYKNKNIRKKEIVDYTNSHSKLRNKIISLKNYYIEKKCSLVFASYLIDQFKKFDNIKDNRKVIMLWHATLGIKSVQDTMLYHFNKKNNYYYVNPTKDCETLRKASSKGFDNCFNIICGKPRNDLIVFNINSKDKFSKLCGFDVSTKKIILVCCTFRKFENNTNLDLFEDEFPIKLNNDDLRFLNNKLEENNTIILIKTHHVQNGISLDKYKNKFSSILFKSENDFDEQNLLVNETFPYTHGLITDYSSIYFDYLLVNKPVGFLHNDLEEYKNDRGLVSKEILDLLIGKNIKNIEDFVLFIQQISNDDKIANQHRKQVSKMINGEYENNCESICKYFDL